MWKLPASLKAGPFSPIEGAKARSGEKQLCSYASPLALGQQARAFWGMDSRGYQFCTGCMVADIEMLTTP